MRIASVSLALAAVLVIAGCGGNKGQQGGEQTGSASEQTTTTSNTAAADPAAYTPPADLDQGPRASATPVNEALATQGAKVFQTRGCVTCHAFGKKVIGPDLKGVAAQRTAKWMEAQILHPAEMTQKDPIAKGLLAQYKTQMTNQGLSPEEAKQVVEYIKKAGK